MQKRLLLGLMLMITFSGCDKKAEGQTVAVVNGEEITSSELNAELATANIPANVDRKQAVARIVQGLIDRRLLAGQAKKEGIDSSPEFVSRERRAVEDLLIGMLASRQLNSSDLPTDAQITALQANQPQNFAQREVWKLGQIQFETPRDPAIRAQVAASKTLEQLADALTRNRISFQRGDNQLVTSAIPPDMFGQLAALKAGEPFIVPNGTRSVASVITSRQPAPLTGAAARTDALNRIRRQNSTQLLQKRLKELHSAAKITYKEGFGPPR